MGERHSARERVNASFKHQKVFSTIKPVFESRYFVEINFFSPQGRMPMRKRGQGDEVPLQGLGDGVPKVFRSLK